MAEELVKHGLSHNFFFCTKQNLAPLFATDCSNWQHHCIVYHPSSNLSRNFMAVLTRAHVNTCFLLRGALQDKLLRKLHSVTGPQHQTLVTCNATFSGKSKRRKEEKYLHFQPFQDKLLRKFRSVTGPLDISYLTSLVF